MQRLQGRVRDYAWGSKTAIPQLFGLPAAEVPVAELWLGAHPGAPTRIGVPRQSLAIDPADLSASSGSQTVVGNGRSLADYVAEDPERVLGADVVARHGSELPFLLKLIAPDQPLSLQVHPSKKQAAEGFARDEAAGVPIESPERNYKDLNHKPELLYALTPFRALAGFRSPRRILGVLGGLDTELTHRLIAQISARPTAEGVRAAFAELLAKDSRPTAQEVDDVVAACERRDPAVSPSARADAIVLKLAEFYPGDPGVVASLLLNPVSLQPGEALFTPVGTVHAYLSGTGVEIMANSDNVLRAGLTQKHIDVEELLAVVDTVAAPPIRIAPEHITDVQGTFYVPVDDFELSVITLRNANKVHRVHGSGPRIFLCLEGAVQVQAGGRRCFLNAGQSTFADAADGPATVRGAGRLIQANVP